LSLYLKIAAVDAAAMLYIYIYIYIYIWLVTAVCLCLYIKTLLAYDRVLEKCFWNFFVTKWVGTLIFRDVVKEVN